MPCNAIRDLIESGDRIRRGFPIIFPYENGCENLEIVEDG